MVGTIPKTNCENIPVKCKTKAYTFDGDIYFAIVICEIYDWSAVTAWSRRATPVETGG